MEGGLQITTSGEGIAIVRMINGENRFRLSFVEAWMKIMDELETNEDIKGVVVTGNGKYFSLGLDRAYFELQTAEYVNETRKKIGELYTRLLLLPVPTVAAINGHAFGAGAFLALSCDYRVMRSDRGWLCWPEVNLNMRISPLSLNLIRLKIPHGKPVRDAVLFGQRLTAKESKELNLVDSVTTLDRLESAAIDHIKRALGPRGIDRHSLKQMKLDIYDSEREANASEASKL